MAGSASLVASPMAGPIFLLTWHSKEKVIDCCFQTISRAHNMARASSWAKCVHIALEWHLLDLPDEYKQPPPTSVLLKSECSSLLYTAGPVN